MEGRVTVAGYEVPSDAAAIVCKHVIEQGTVLLFSHDDDGVMQFVCGCEAGVANGRVVHVGHVLDWHPDLNGLPVIHPGHEAERLSNTSPWIVTKSIEITDADASTSSREGLNP